MKQATTALTGEIEEQKEDETAKMSFLDHLDELRRRLVRIVTYLGVGFIGCWVFHKEIYRFIKRPIDMALPPGDQLVMLSPTDGIVLYMKVAFVGAIFVTVPLSLYEVWKFISPGLYRKEKRYVVPFLVSSVFLFVAGGAFCYLYVMPQAFNFLIAFGSDFKAMISVMEYWDMSLMMLLGFATESS